MRYIILLIFLGLVSCEPNHNQKKKEIYPIFREQSSLLNEEEMYNVWVTHIKSFENFSPIAKWDVNNWRGGWGTTCRKNEVFSIDKANMEMEKAFKRRIEQIKHRFPNLNMWQTYTVAAFHYNVQHFGHGLEQSLHQGDNEKIAEYMLQYINKGSIYEDGLLKRRVAEVKMLLSNGKREIVSPYYSIVNTKVENIITQNS